MNMKKVLALVAAAGLIAAASTAFAAVSIVGTKHDLSLGGNNLAKGTNTQICVYCHTPHNAAVSTVLWNRNNPAGSNFTLYSGVGMENKSFKSGFTADSTSLFCMSCHDGGTNMNAVTRPAVTSGTLTSGFIGGGSAANLTSDLRKTHPVNFPVGTANLQADLWVGSGATMGNGALAAIPVLYGTDVKGFPLFKSARDVAGTTRSLECGSCHAVHDNSNAPFLRYTMTKSALCLGCHNK